MSETVDNVNHPRHYELPNGMECFDAIRVTQGDYATLDFCICNAMKYIWRHRNKNHLEDVKKAYWYLGKYIDISEELLATEEES